MIARPASGDHVPGEGQGKGGPVMAGMTRTGARRGLLDQAWLLMMLTALFWAGNAILGRAVAGEVPPIGLAFWRWVVGTALVLPFAWHHLPGDLPALRRHWRVVVVLSVLGVGVFN